MQCSNCGHERPRSGKCPHCGAPASSASSSSHPSSLRGWRDGAQSSGSRSSGTNWDDDLPPSRSPNSRPVGNNDSRSRGSGAGWGAADATYGRRPGDSVPRRGDPAGSYARRDDYDDYGANDRALMPSPGMGGALMPQLDDRALPALPSEEEERALGIRRPAYIPATEARKGERPSNMRVVSGVASILLLCVAMLGISGFLVQRNVLPGFLQALGFAHQQDAPAVKNALPTQFVTLKPVVTPSATNKTPLVQMSSYQSFINGPNPDAPVVPQNATSVFLVGRYVHVIGTTNDQTKQNDQISIKWFFNDVDATDSIKKSSGSQNSKQDCCLYVLPSSKAGKQNQIRFSLLIPITTRGKAEIYYNGQLAYTILFMVVDQIPPTPQVGTPAAGTPIAGTPSPAPTKKP